MSDSRAIEIKEFDDFERDVVEHFRQLTSDQKQEFIDFLTRLTSGQSLAEACMALGPDWDHVIKDVTEKHGPH